MLVYEYPLNERVRNLLRLEELFQKAQFFIESTDARQHHIALLTLFEIVDVAGRADIKSDIITELDRQKQLLSNSAKKIPLSEEQANQRLQGIESARLALSNMIGRTGQHVREDEWLMSIRNRLSIPGGACEFDHPSYYFWRHQHILTRQTDLRAWLEPIVPLYAGIVLLLQIIRDSSPMSPLTAIRGQFNQALSGRNVQMIRICLDNNVAYIPEISASKHAIMIRFKAMNSGVIKEHHRKLFRMTDANVPFDVAYCAFPL